MVEKDDKRILFSGDVIASLNLGPATYPVNISPRFRGNAADYLETINRLLDLEPPDLLLTGHPRQYRRMQPLTLNQQQWNQLLEPAKEELEVVLAHHESDGADFLDDVPKQIEPGLLYLGQLESIAVYCLISESDVVVINAPGGDNYASFLKSGFEALGRQPRDPTAVLSTSSNEANYSGVKSLNSSPRVVAPESAVASLQASGIQNIDSGQQIEAFVSQPVQPIPLTDSLLAYSLSIGTRQVIITPDVPRNIILIWKDRRNGKQTRSKLSPQYEDLLEAFTESSDFAVSYRDSLQRLIEFSPDVWLPAMPLTGQNANLYDDDWQLMIENNLNVVKGFTD